jgi:ribosomal protein S18 acetylase RimI-like enzyme
MMSIEIRPLTPDDAAAARELRLEAVHTNPEAFASSYADEQRRTVADMRARLENPESPGDAIFGAWVAERLRGMVGVRQELRLKLRHKAMIWGMYVAPDQRGRGLGKALLAAAIARARQMPGVEQVNLAVVATNTTARRLYLAHGFEIYGYERRALKHDDQYLDEEFMVLWLS